MKLPILQTSNKDLKTFIEYWKVHYNYPLEKLYNGRIHKIEFDQNDLQQLFIWKNGMKLSDKKQKSFEAKILRKINLINKFKAQNNIDLNEFKNNFSNLTAVWKIFLLHIIKPTKFPIYDQHINRAYNYIHELDYSNINASSISNKNKESFYFGTYLSFINSLADINLKDIDEAFFAFGQFINTKSYVKLIE